MNTPAVDPVSTALLGLLRSQNRVATDAQDIAGGNIGQAAAPLTGGQPSNAAGQVFQATQGNTDLLASVVDLSVAKNSYQANADVLKVTNDLNRRALDIIS